MFHLVVLHHFEGRLPGEMIDDPNEVARILAGPHQHHVVKRLAPNTPVVSSEAAPVLHDAHDTE
jgi:hypothetical protein